MATYLPFLAAGRGELVFAPTGVPSDSSNALTTITGPAGVRAICGEASRQPSCSNSSGPWERFGVAASPRDDHLTIPVFPSSAEDFALQAGRRVALICGPVIDVRHK